jgi:uncharacterized protein (DUF2141 family)
MLRNALFASALAAAALSATATELSFQIAGIEGAEGQLLVALYDEGGFLKTAFKSVRLKPDGGTAAGTFGDVAPGVYAAVAFHDENGNGKVDFNPVGIPVERMGFSNDAKVLMGPPSFAASKFDVEGAAKSIAFTLR